MCLTSRIAFALVAVTIGLARQPPARAEPIEARIVPAPPEDPDFYGTSNFWVVSGYGNTCTIKRISFGATGCRLMLMFEHGASLFSCGNSGPGSTRWYWTSGRFFGDAITSIGATRRVKLPAHSKARKTWIGPVDREGLEHAGYPINGDDMNDWYPRKILNSDLQPLQNRDNPFPIFTQQVTYKTMHGQTRSFVGGRIVFASGADLTNYRWVAPDQAPEAARAGQLLASINLIPVINPPTDVVAQVCQVPKQK